MSMTPSTNPVHRAKPEHRVPVRNAIVDLNEFMQASPHWPFSGAVLPNPLEEPVARTVHAALLIALYHASRLLRQPQIKSRGLAREPA
jgi:hypothetical protein